MLDLFLGGCGAGAIISSMMTLFGRFTLFGRLTVKQALWIIGLCTPLCGLLVMFLDWQFHIKMP